VRFDNFLSSACGWSGVEARSTLDRKKMNDQTALRHWRKIEALDTRAVKRTIAVIRQLSAWPITDHLQEEIESLGFWWTQRRVSRSELRKLERGAL